MGRGGVRRLDYKSPTELYLKKVIFYCVLKYLQTLKSKRNSERKFANQTRISLANIFIFDYVLEDIKSTRISNLKKQAFPNAGVIILWKVQITQTLLNIISFVSE